MKLVSINQHEPFRLRNSNLNIPLFHAPPCFHANLLNELEASVGFIVEVEIPLNIFATFPEATYCPSIGGAASFFGAIGSGIVQGGSSVVAGAQVPATGNVFYQVEESSGFDLITDSPPLPPRVSF